ncbi:hypothetical protein R3P38DRAFT_2803919 [Favolaschia claudopus]|uniref:Uncharacterized protein n=1 Tax=Favolaschia claudopus TaxID=2862362 RepID=A0AAV9ZRD2_9AGAR
MSDTPDEPADASPPTLSLSKDLYIHPNANHTVPADSPSEEEALTRVTLRKRNPRVERVADPIPDTSRVLRQPKPSQQPTPRSTPSPHRPGPQISIVSKSRVTADTIDPPPERVRDTAKKEKFDGLRDKAESASSLDDLAQVLGETIGIMRTYNSAPIKACFSLLDAICERLAAHHELAGAVGDASNFSTVLSRAVVSPVKTMSAQIDAQQRAIQSLTKSVESLKNAPLLSSMSTTASSASYAKVVASGPPSPKPKPPPLPRGPEQRILVRFNGPPPPIYSSRYDRILEEINAHLERLSLPGLLFVQKGKTPLQGEEGVAILLERWDIWAPGISPGARIVPVVTHTFEFVQIDGIQFGSVQSLSALKTEFEVRNPELGPVVGEPRWKNAPPSPERIAFLASAGRKVPTRYGNKSWTVGFCVVCDRLVQDAESLVKPSKTPA